MEFHFHDLYKQSTDILYSILIDYYLSPLLCICVLVILFKMYTYLDMVTLIDVQILEFIFQPYLLAKSLFQLLNE